MSYFQGFVYIFIYSLKRLIQNWTVFRPQYLQNIMHRIGFSSFFNEFKKKRSYTDKKHLKILTRILQPFLNFYLIFRYESHMTDDSKTNFLNISDVLLLNKNVFLNKKFNLFR